MNIQNPLFAVIIPIFNTGGYLGQCLESLLAQSFGDWEAVCINDGSTDASPEILAGYAFRDRRFRVYAQENRGLAATRNAGIKRARGEYIVFLDSDDCLAPQALQTLHSVIKESNLEVISYETELLYEEDFRARDNRDYWYLKKHPYPGIRPGRELFLSMVERREYCDAAWLLCVRREWLFSQGILFYEGILYEDTLFSLHCFLSAKQMLHLSKRLYVYRIRANSIMTGKARWENVRSRLVVYREVLKQMLMAERGDMRLQRALAAYLQDILHYLKYLDASRTDPQPDLPMPPLDQVLLESMELGKYRREVNEHVILCGIEKLVADSGGIMLYGAGNVGHLFLRFLDSIGMKGKARCFIVSGEGKINTRFIDGVPVLPLDEIEDRDALVFVSVIDGKARKEIAEELASRHFRRVELCDESMYSALRRHLSGFGSG